MTRIEMQELPPHLSGDSEQKKLLVEIVHGLLMAHARLDTMDEALRRTVETASRQHLDAFQVELRTVDMRFENTASDLAQTIASLTGARDQLLQAVERASTDHLEAFTKELGQMDARFQEAAGQVHGTVRSLQAIRDNLVGSVEAATAQHVDAFSQQVFELQNSIKSLKADDLRLLQQELVALNQLGKTRHAEVITQAETHAKQVDSLYLDRRLAQITEMQSTNWAWTEALAMKQATNWATLNEFLLNLQLSLRASHSELNTAAMEMNKSIGADGIVVRKRFVEIAKFIQDVDTSHLKEMRGLHVRLNWFIFLMFAAVAMASSIVYHIWLR